MTEFTNERIIEVLEMIAKDMAADAENFEGEPFTGHAVAEYFGNHGAAIAALANIVRSLVESQPVPGGYCPDYPDTELVVYCPIDGCEQPINTSESRWKKRVEELENALRPFAFECPFIFDKATIPQKGIDAAPQQVVVNMSVGWLRIVQAREALEG